MRKCSKCEQNKEQSEFNFKNKKKGIRHVYCKFCTRGLIKNHYKRNKEYYLKKAYIRNEEFKKKVFEYIKKYLIEHPCVDCGESDIIVLEFDHRREDTKFKAVSSLIRSQYPFGVIKNEIDKCDVRCANCHRRKTAKDFNWQKLDNMPL